MNNSSVVVTGDESGNIVVPSKNNLEYGYIMVQQEKITINENGFGSIKILRALIKGLLKDLNSFKWTVGTVLPGNIVVKEQLTPFNAKNPERDYKIAGETNIICSFEGNPIYRRTLYTGNLNAVDEYVAHDNIQEIYDAYKKIEEEQIEEQQILERKLENKIGKL